MELTTSSHDVHGNTKAGMHVMLRLTRPGWAWEWLRRVPAYAAFARTATVCFDRAHRLRPRQFVITAPTPACDPVWGVLYPPDPCAFYARTAVFWRPDVDPAILSVVALPASFSPSDAFDLARLRVTATVLREPGGPEHVLLSNSFQTIQLQIVHGTVLDGPVRLSLAIENLAQGSPIKNATAERLHALQRHGRFPVGAFAPPPEALRWLRWLNAYDLEQSGLTHAEIALRLFDAEHVSATLQRGASHWPLSRVQRALRNAHRVIDGDYLKMLSGEKLGCVGR